jgi:hypothetical protein
MDFTFIRTVGVNGESAWEVLVDGAVIGRLDRRDQIGLNLTKSFPHSGPGRRVSLWEGTVDNADLTADEAHAVQQRIRRPKTNRLTAAQHICAAYAAAGVDLPHLAGAQAA